MRSAASAPAARASSSWYSDTMKSFRNGGVDTDAHGHQAFECPIEERRLGQHGDGCGTGGTVSRGNRDRVVVSAHTARR